MPGWLKDNTGQMTSVLVYTKIQKILLCVFRPTIDTQIGTAQDVKERMRNWSEEMEPRIIGWKVAALFILELTFHNIWGRNKIKAKPADKHELSENHWNDVYSRVDDQSRLEEPKLEPAVMLKLNKELKGGIYVTIEGWHHTLMNQCGSSFMMKYFTTRVT